MGDLMQAKAKLAGINGRLLLLLCGLLLSAWCAADSVVHERQAMFGTIVITEDDSGVRTLRFGRSGPRQSVVKPGDPDHLVLQYTRSAFVGLALAEAPRRMLVDRKSTRLNSSHSQQSRMPSSA